MIKPAHFAATVCRKTALHVAQNIRATVKAEPDPIWPDFETDRADLAEWFAKGMPENPLFVEKRNG